MPDQDELDAVAGVVRDMAAADLGARPNVAEGPAAILTGSGPSSFWLRLSTDDPRWSGGLMVRDLDDETLAHEAAWLRAMRAAGFPVPDLVTDPPGEVLVYRQPPGINLTAQMIKDLAGVAKLLAGFGELHARLHRVPTAGLDQGAAAAADPLAELEDRATSPAVHDAVADEIDWLRRRRPDARGAVACHTEFNPLHVYLDGGDFSTATALNWTRARLADPEYDVAATVVALWSVPLFLDNAMYRKGMKMAREPVTNAYLEGYKGSAARPLNDQAMAYWQVHHLTKLVIDATRKLNNELGSPWDVARGVINPEGTIKEIRAHIREVAGG
jgi:aminoglycoside phosphotransferase (APT) family kinase protein